MPCRYFRRIGAIGRRHRLVFCSVRRPLPRQVFLFLSRVNFCTRGLSSSTIVASTLKENFYRNSLGTNCWPSGIESFTKASSPSKDSRGPITAFGFQRSVFGKLVCLSRSLVQIDFYAKNCQIPHNLRSIVAVALLLLSMVFCMSCLLV